MPVALDVPTQLLSDGEEGTADVVVTDHPVFRIFAGQRNSFLTVAQVNFYYAVQPESREADADVQVIARLQNGAPFVVEKKLGEGRVMLHLSKLSPKSTSLGVWSNWSLNPVFPVVANELAGYLTATQRIADVEEVGSELRFAIPEEDYEPEVQVHTPGRAEQLTLTPQTADGDYIVEAGRAPVSGVWQFGLQPRQDAPASHLVAVNVAEGEGDLHHLDRAAIRQEFSELDYQFSMAAEISATDEQLAGFRLGDTALVLLLLALVAEQWLAYKASYHTAGGRA
jgi:hypothetical protein